MARINESNTLTKHTICKCKCKFDSKKCNSNQKQNNDKYQYEYKNPRKNQVCEKEHVWNPSTCTCENGKYLESIFDDSVITCDPKNFNEKKR